MSFGLLLARSGLFVVSSLGVRHVFEKFGLTLRLRLMLSLRPSEFFFFLRFRLMLGLMIKLMLRPSEFLFF